MGKTTEELNIKVTGDSKRGRDALKKTEEQLGKVGKKAKKTNSVLGNFKKNWIGITAATAGLVIAVKKVVGAFAEQEKQQRTLAAAMKQAGTFTEDAFQENLKFASSLQKMTTFGDEAILGVQKMLTNFGVEGQAMKDLTQATLDLAAAKGMDLRAAADLVAKSVGSSTNALTRYGITVEGAAGSTERMDDAVKNITKIFGGAAAAEADTFAGSMTQLKNIFGDFQEKIGGTIAKFIKPLIGVLKTLVLVLDGMPESMRILGIALVGAFTVGIVAAKLFGVTLSVATAGISLLVGAVIAGTILMIQHWDSVVFAFEVAWAAIKIGLLEAGSFMLEFIPIMFKPWFIQFDLVIKGLNLLPKVNLKTLTEMTADLQAATDKQAQIEKDGLTAILKAHKDAMAKKKELRDKDKEDEKLSLDELVEKIIETSGKILPIITELSAAIFSIGDQIHKNIMANLKIELAEKQGLFNTENEFTAQLAAMDATARTVTMNGLKAEIIAAKAAGDTELANEKQLALDRMVLEDAASERAEVIADEKAGFERDAQIKIATAEHKAAQFSKAKAVAESIFGTAAAVVKALPNIPLSIAVGILGGIKTGLIGAQTIPPIPSFAMGGEFTARGSQLIRVGDNPGQEERVKITPSEQFGNDAPSIVIQSLTVMANNVNEMAESIFDQAELAGARPFKRGGFA